ncbi:MAG: DUF488 domain-containing protein [Candidatus Brocadiae bacterium]|nr:DUF488 domain-containing protein [Candidatus Brocadiia bacterium]
MKPPPHILTVGHSNHPPEKLIELLRAHGVTAVADVRSQPYSRYTPQFNRETLEAILKREGLAYVFLGRELGARSDDRSCYDQSGRVRYERLAATDLFRSGLQRVLQGAAKHRIALLCAEKEPLECHRTLLVSLELARQGVSISHILASGELESHEATLDRLLEMEKLGGADLFRSRAEKLSEACARQERRIAYTADPNAALQELP